MSEGIAYGEMGLTEDDYRLRTTRGNLPFSKTATGNLMEVVPKQNGRGRYSRKPQAKRPGRFNVKDRRRKQA